MPFHIRALALAIGLILPPAAGPALAAAGTTCLCRSEDGKTFQETTLRHSRWACDVKLGYLKPAEPEENPAPTRPTTQTCNPEEIVQFKVWICMQRGCTYAYARGIEARNKALERIEALKGERRP